MLCRYNRAGGVGVDPPVPSCPPLRRLVFTQHRCGAAVPAHSADRPMHRPRTPAALVARGGVRLQLRHGRSAGGRLPVLIRNTTC